VSGYVSGYAASSVAREHRVSCVIADDHPAVIYSISAILEENGFEIVGTASTGDEALAQIEEHRPQVALIDLRMPGPDGLEVARRASRTSPDTAMILFTGHAEPAVLTAAFDAGARGLVLKELPVPEFVRAVQVVSRGGTYFDPGLAGVLASAQAAQTLPELTQRERDILRLLADGRSTEDIGQALFISRETVRAHVRKAMRKLDATTRTEAVAIALRRAVIS
jgi:two-component system response regulator DesR